MKRRVYRVLRGGSCFSNTRNLCSPTGAALPEYRRGSSGFCIVVKRRKR